jgi:SAM-dependent methyltransferase
MGIGSLIYKFGLSLKKNSAYLIYGRDIVSGWAVEHLKSTDSDKKSILDIGCGKGDDLFGIKQKISENVQLFGLETYEPYRKIASEKGITVTAFNLETERMPFDNGFFDVIILNQILEHTKELFFIFDELSRVLKPDGCLIIGVPNLAAWHDRLMILLGEEPTGAKVLGPHIRGFTCNGFIKFIEITGGFKVEKVKGSGFLPFPVPLAKVLARCFPSFATSLFLKVRHQQGTRRFADVVKERQFETNFRVEPEKS